MKISVQKATWTSISFLLALMSGAPAMADDTELLLINPDPTQNPVRVCGHGPEHAGYQERLAGVQGM